MFEKIHLRQRLDTIVDPPHTTNTLFRINIVHEKERFFFKTKILILQNKKKTVFFKKNGTLKT